MVRFWVASTAFETSSRKKISWSLYRNFLMIGKMLSVVTLIVPCCAMAKSGFGLGLMFEFCPNKKDAPLMRDVLVMSILVPSRHA